MEDVFYPMMRLIQSSWGKQGLLVLCLKTKKRGCGGGGRWEKRGKRETDFHGSIY